mmetsp:Transcript_28876/g.39962  ORF Transcript_28876/g.39962 Transcript_28876/m.39962 type:complete len:230 (-) Transcript_28876:142-831(-)
MLCLLLSHAIIKSPKTFSTATRPSARLAPGPNPRPLPPYQGPLHDQESLPGGLRPAGRCQTSCVGEKTRNVPTIHERGPHPILVLALRPLSTPLVPHPTLFPGPQHRLVRSPSTKRRSDPPRQRIRTATEQRKATRSTYRYAPCGGDRHPLLFRPPRLPAPDLHSPEGSPPRPPRRRRPRRWIGLVSVRKIRELQRKRTRAKLEETMSHELGYRNDHVGSEERKTQMGE